MRTGPHDYGPREWGVFFFEVAGSLRAGSESEVVNHARHAEGLEALQPCAERAAGLDSLHWREGHARTERERGELRADESISVEAF